MKRAKRGDLTFAEYYGLIKANLMETMPGIERFSAEQKAKIAELVNGLTPEQVERLQDRILALPSADSPDYEEKVKQFEQIFLQESAVAVTESFSNSDGINSTKTTYKAKEPYVLQNGAEKMEFAEVYSRRMGVEYSREKIERFEALNSAYSIQKSVNQAQKLIHQSLDEAESGGEISDSVIKLLSGLSGSSDDSVLTELLQSMSGMSDVKVQNGQVVCKNLQELKQKLLVNIDERAMAINDGKSFETLSKEYEQAYKEAYGTKNVELLAKAYAEDQTEFVQNARKTVEITGSAASVIGLLCCPPLAIGAGLVGSVGGIGLEMLDEATKDTVSKEKMDALKKELAMNSTLFAAGMGSGMLGSAAGGIASAFVKKCPNFAAFVAEHGVDAAASAISTMVLTGELDLSAEGVNQLISVLAGLKTSKIGIKNAKYDAQNMGIMYNPARKEGFFSQFLNHTRGSVDLEPGNPLNKYKLSQKSYGNCSHWEFIQNNSHLFAGNKTSGWWSYDTGTDRHHGAWKMHLFAVNEADWQKMADVIIPYLRERGIEWKTLSADRTFEGDLNRGKQRGKAFTIYPRNNADMEQIARDLDYIIRNNGLQTSGSNITGDRQMGSTGRLFYRYELDTGALKDEVLDLSNPRDREIYNRHYDANRGEGNYLARDMSPSDDIWLNFDPSNPSSRPSTGRKADFSYNQITRQGRLQPGAVYALGNVRSLRIANVDIDLSEPWIMNMLKNMPDRSYIKVGRDSSCQIRVRPECGAVSREHLIIYKMNGQIFIRDISTNGTFVN